MTVQAPAGAKLTGGSVRLLVAGQTTKAALSNGRAAFRVDAIDDHEVVVIE